MHNHQQITQLINKLKKSWERTNEGNTGISRIDKDILISDLRILYDIVSDLEVISTYQKTNIPKEEVAEEMEIEKKPDHQVTNTIANNNKPTKVKSELPHKPLDLFDSEPESQQEIKKTKPQDVEFEIVVAGQELPFGEENEKPETPDLVVEKKKEKNPRNKKAKPQQSTSDLFSATKTLSDIYQTNNDNSLGVKMQKNHITDIKAAIGINEKFLFINDIFNGEMAEYSQAIDKLNSCNQYHEAIQFVDELKLLNKVDNTDAWDKLIDIIKRKFY